MLGKYKKNFAHQRNLQTLIIEIHKTISPFATLLKNSVFTFCENKHNIHKYRHKERRTDGRTDRQTGRQTDRQTDKTSIIDVSPGLLHALFYWTNTRYEK